MSPTPAAAPAQPRFLPQSPVPATIPGSCPCLAGRVDPVMTDMEGKAILNPTFGERPVHQERHLPKPALGPTAGPDPARTHDPHTTRGCHEHEGPNPDEF